MVGPRVFRDQPKELATVSYRCLLVDESNRANQDYDDANKDWGDWLARAPQTVAVESFADDAHFKLL